MKQFLTAILILSVVLISFAQKEINNTKSDQHKQISGTKFFFVPPDDFVVAISFQGFQQANTASSILVMEIPGPFLETTGQMNEQGLKSRGMTLKEKQDVVVNGYKGILLLVEQFAQNTKFSKYILAFGDTKVTFLINGTFPAELQELGKKILASMFTVVYQSDLTIDPLASVPFSVNTEGTKLKFAKNLSGTLLYSVDGKIPTQSEDRTSFVIGMSVANIPTVDKKMTAINRVKMMPYKEVKIDENKVTPIEIDGISGYEIVAEGTNNTDGGREFIYEVMLFTDTGYYIIVGSAKTNFDSNLELFKKVTRTLRRR